LSSAWGFEKREQEPPQSERTLVQLPLLNFVGKGSDTYPSHISQMFVHIGRIIPPLSSLERRKEPEAQGGEFVEAYIAKRTKQISHEEKPLQGECCRW
tara:strand:+ start:87 stop:380 length:294 start_codon:yes stop_codon:yes gene_type:complete